MDRIHIFHFAVIRAFSKKKITTYFSQTLMEGVKLMLDKVLKIKTESARPSQRGGAKGSNSNALFEFKGDRSELIKAFIIHY